MEDKNPFVNPYWPSLGGARPRLHDQVRITRQEIRGHLWYVVEDKLSGRHFRVTPEAHLFVGLLDGSRTVDEAMEAAELHLGDAAPGKGEAMRLLAQLHGAGALSSVGTMPDTDAIYQRGITGRRRRWIQQLRSPLAIRIPLLDPDRILRAMQPLGRVVFSRLGLLVWLVVVGYGAATAAVHLDELSANFLDRVLAAENIVLMTIAFAVMKLFHEFGHGLAAKRWGGEVHEMGVMFLVLIPIPYVDASSANSFASRLNRVIVSAAGMYVEMFLAAIAIILWARVEPGTTRAVLYNAALVGSVSTLLFNINPLLRFDGYYILSDAASLPNLGSRAQRFFRYLLQRWLIRLDDASTPEIDPAEKRWLFVYQVASACYRVFIVLAIAFFVAKKFFFIGIMLAIWAIGQMVLLPIYGAIRFLVLSPRLKQTRWGALRRTATAVAVVVALLFGVPAPHTTTAWGVVWVPPEGEIVATADGFVEEIDVPEGAIVEADDVLIRARNAPLIADRERLLARKRALEARYNAEFATDQVAARLTGMELGHTDNRLAALAERIAGLEIRAGTPGTFSLALPEDMIGRYIRRGELLGFVIPAEISTIKVVVSQTEIGLVRDDLVSVSVMPVHPGAKAIPVSVVRATPRASPELPSMALSTHGGGDFETVPDDQGRQVATEDLFHFELAAPPGQLRGRVGEKVNVKFVHSFEPIGFQVWRRLRQLFLSELEV